MNVIKHGHPCPLFLLELNPNTNNKEILSLSSIFHTKLKVKLPYKTKSGPPQCRNCQNYGHTANYCHHPSRCVKCGGDHRTKICTKNKTSLAKCALCMGNHTSNYKGCQIFKALLKPLKTTHSKLQNPNPVPTHFSLSPNSPFPFQSFLRLRYRFQKYPTTQYPRYNDKPLIKFISELSSLITHYAPYSFSK